jgi:hypothetical protein
MLQPCCTHANDVASGKHLFAGASGQFVMLRGTSHHLLLLLLMMMMMMIGDDDDDSGLDLGRFIY